MIYKWRSQRGRCVCSNMQRRMGLTKREITPLSQYRGFRGSLVSTYSAVIIKCVNSQAESFYQGRMRLWFLFNIFMFLKLFDKYYTINPILFASNYGPLISTAICLKFLILYVNNKREVFTIFKAKVTQNIYKNASNH